MRIVDRTPNSDDRMMRAISAIRVLRARWYLYPIALVLALGAAVIYLASTPKEYTRKASVMIKEDAKTYGSAAIDLADFSLRGFRRNIDNEILILKSTDLMESVVRALGLDQTYTVKDGLLIRQLYTDRPVDVILPAALRLPGIEAVVRLSADSAYTVVIDDDHLPSPVTAAGRLGSPASTPCGDIVVQARGLVPAGMIGRDIVCRYNDAAAVAAGYVPRLKVTQASEKSSILDIAFSDPSKARADSVILKLVEIYERNWLEEQLQANDLAFGTISDRIDLVNADLQAVDNEISAYKAGNGMPDVAMMAARYVDLSMQIDQDIYLVESRISAAQGIRQAVAACRDTVSLPSAYGIDDQLTARDVAQYNETLRQRAHLLAKGSESSPAVVAANGTLDALRPQILRSVDSHIDRLTGQLASLRSRRSAIRQMIEAAPVNSRDLLAIERQQKVKETLYMYLLQKREENELTGSFSRRITKIIDNPHGGDRPSSPSTLMVFAIALLAGVVAPTACIVAEHACRKCVKYIKNA